MNLYTIQFFGVHRYRIIGGNKKVNLKSRRKVTAGTLNNRLERQKVEDKSSKFNEYNEFVLVQGVDNLGLVEDRPTELPGEPKKSESAEKKQNPFFYILHVLSIVTREWIFDPM